MTSSLPAHTRPEIGVTIRATGALLRHLPPDLNSIEMAFAKLKAFLRKDAARPMDALWDAIADALKTSLNGICSRLRTHDQ
jgi:hypothetical protein